MRCIVLNTFIKNIPILVWGPVLCYALTCQQKKARYWLYHLKRYALERLATFEKSRHIYNEWHSPRPKKMPTKESKVLTLPSKMVCIGKICDVKKFCLHNCLSICLQHIFTTGSLIPPMATQAERKVWNFFFPHFNPASPSIFSYFINNAICPNCMGNFSFPSRDMLYNTDTQSLHVLYKKDSQSLHMLYNKYTQILHSDI